MRFSLLLIFILLLSSYVSAATLQGKVYTYDLERAKNVVVELSTTPQQRIVSTDGIYQFYVPLGKYDITVYDQDNSQLLGNDNVTLTKEGTYTLDIILPFKEKEHSSLAYILGTLFILCVAGLLLLHEKTHHFAERLGKSLRLKKKLPVITNDKEKLLTLIKEAGGRITQKELRKHFTLSEAKISLLITELEHDNTIKKIKQGRGNIIILP